MQDQDFHLKKTTRFAWCTCTSLLLLHGRPVAEPNGKIRHFHIFHNAPYPHPPPPPKKMNKLLFFISPGYYSRSKRNLCKLFFLGGGGSKKGAFWEMWKCRKREDPGDGVGVYAGSPLKKGKMADGSPRMNCVDIYIDSF